MGLRSLHCTVLAGMLLLPPGADAEPAQIHRGTMHDALYGMCLDGQRGIAVGAGGLILESSDGGLNWAPGRSFTESALLDVSCGAGPSLIVAQQGGIYRWDDGAYQAVDSGTDARLLGVASNSAGLAVAVGSFGAILRSQNGGLNWEPVTVDWEAILNDVLEPHLYAVEISRSGAITIVGEFELVMRSLDGGETWETAHTGEASLFGLGINDDGSGFAVGQDGRVLRTRDGGASWAAVPTPTGSILLNVWSAAGEVLVSGIRTLLRSSDGGNSWVLEEGGDINVGWYQGLVVMPGTDTPAAAALLAGHQGSIIKLQLN